jgi:prepilin-type N-terminal cleavage/methylation domain-containing protein/prepilin-type processing-associated H-X9-DG protein
MKRLLGLKVAVRRSSAFTLIELLVVIAIIAILAAVLLPVLQAARNRGEAARCIANQSQLTKAWLMYAADNNDGCAGNYWPDEEGYLSHPRENWIAGWLGADGSGGDGTGGNKGGPDNTNTAILVNANYSTLGDYIRNPGIFLCPSSVVLAPTTSGGPKNSLMVRSVSMNCWMGWNSTNTPDPNGVGYRNYNRVSDLKAGLGPADAFVFMEERAESIDDGWFEIGGPGNANVYNWPTDYHDLGATVGFADGHVEIHRWLPAKGLTIPNFTVVQQTTISAKWGSVAVSAFNFPAALSWQEQHAVSLH